MHRIAITLSIFFVLFGAGCATTTGDTPDEQRQAILAMQEAALADLYKKKPDVKAQLAGAPGFAVFSNANINVILASFGGGYGVVTDNNTGQHTYMKMGEVGVGLGLGAKDFRLILIFHTPGTMNRFIDRGWAFGAQADAAAKAGDKGGAVGGEATVSNITIYQITEAGLALQATVKGTKFWKDDSLN